MQCMLDSLKLHDRLSQNSSRGSCLAFRMFIFSLMNVIGCLHNPANVQQTSSKCIQMYWKSDQLTNTGHHR